jgi:hypothetical protein
MGWQITFDGTKRDPLVVAEDRKKDPFASVWEGGKVVDFDDLSPAFFDKIAEADKTASWYGVYLSPMSDAARLQRVVRACAEYAGVEVPAPPTNMREAKLLLTMFEETEDPTGESSELMTGSSTGPSPDSVGSPLPLEENASATS